MSEPKLTLHDVLEILKLVEAAEHVVDFSFKYGDVEVRMSRLGGQAAPQTLAAPETMPGAPAAAPPEAPAPSAKPADAVPSGMAAVTAPMVGTFYRAPSPGATPFVEVGHKVAPDSVVCIIEVMKLMSSIAAGVSGTVREIRVADSQAVQFGQVLIVIEPGG